MFIMTGITGIKAVRTARVLAVVSAGVAAATTALAIKSVVQARKVVEDAKDFDDGNNANVTSDIVKTVVTGGAAVIATLSSYKFNRFTTSGVFKLTRKHFIGISTDEVGAVYTWAKASKQHFDKMCALVNAYCRHVNVDVEDLFDPKSDELWKHIFSGLGVVYTEPKHVADVGSRFARGHVSLH